MARIVQMVESLEAGGAERVVVDLSNALAERHEVTVVCVKRIGQLAEQLSRKITLECLEKPEGNDIRTLWRLARLLRSRHAHVVHTHHWGIFLDGVAAGDLARVPSIVHTVHGKYGGYVAGVLPALKKAGRHWLERRAARRCRKIVCVSDALIEHVVEQVGIPASALQTVVNGVAVDPDTNALRSRRADECTFVAVGRLAPVKNFAMMIDAFAKACHQHAGLRLLVVGDGPERAALERRVLSLGLGQRVELLGFRSNVSAILGAADAFALSSLSEGTPMAVLEAMRAGLPVVATRVGGVPSIVIEGETGLLVPSGDVEAMSAAMIAIATSAERSKAMGEAAFRRVLEHFSARTMVAAYEKLYGLDEAFARTGSTVFLGAS